MAKFANILAAVLLLVIAVPGNVVKAVPLQSEMVRVAILKGVDNLKIAGSGVLVFDEAGAAASFVPPFTIKRNGDWIWVNGRSFRSLRFSAPGSLQVNGKGYRGVIEVSAKDKGLQVVNELPLEQYLIGLINCEISSQWPIESIKTQAVIARSYAFYQMQSRRNAPYHLESSVMDQVYDGSDAEDSRAARGVEETAGEVLAFDGRVIQAFYHSNCGGHTEAAENVWGYPVSYLQGVACKYCAAAGAARWEYSVGLKKLEAQLKSGGIQVTGLRDIKPGRRNSSGRLAEVLLLSAKGTEAVSAVTFRKAVGYSIVKSTNFDIRTAGDDAFFSGAGYGHGVGLCQWGSKQRAEDGFNYEEILAYYYPGTQLRKIGSDK